MNQVIILLIEKLYGRWCKMNKTKILILCLIVVVTIFFFGLIYPQRESQKLAEQKSITEEELIIIPEDFKIYQDYIETIGGKPKIYDTIIIEATILSIAKSEVCPYQEENCSIEPYPRDSGVIRIDRIIEYNPSFEHFVEQVGGEKSTEKDNMSKGYEGSEYSSKFKPPLFGKLQEGQELQVFFLLSARPAIVRYLPINECGSGIEMLELTSDDENPQESDEHQIEPEKRIFKPIPKEGIYLIFATRIGDFQKTIEVILPGLEAGTKFTAVVYYDGVFIFIEEYNIHTRKIEVME